MGWPNYEPDEIDAVVRVLKSGKVNYWTGNEVETFENEFATWAGSKYGIALSNGTIALELALASLEIGIRNGGSAKDQVIVTPSSFIASASCVIKAGAKAVFADVDPFTGNLSPVDVERKVNTNTKAVIAVHLGGLPCEIESLRDIAKHNDIFLIEDCSQAHGASVKGKKVGTFGCLATWSFCQDKIISTGGEGGMVTTDFPELRDKIWSLKDHGKSISLRSDPSITTDFPWVHKEFGSNYRLTEMQAAIGRRQLLKVDQRVSARNTSVLRLQEQMDSVGGSSFFRQRGSHQTRGQIVNAFYRLYLGWNSIGPQDLEIKSSVIKALWESGFKANFGSCAEIYREACFQDLSNGASLNLRGAKTFGETHFALLVDHTFPEQYLDQLASRLNELSASLKKQYPEN